MLVRLLGPVEVEINGTRLAVGGPRQRALLADLALQAGRTILKAQLVDDLWGDTPPASARHTVEAYISRLRGAMAKQDGATVLLTRGQGYLLDVSPDSVDVLRFRRLVGEARAAALDDAERADRLLSGALALWRGPALADVREATFAAAAAAHCESERLDALETLFDVRLRLGRHGEVVADVERAIEAHPYRERFRGQLMLALYRGGRQADALAVFQRTRRLFADELGLEPGPELCRLERDVLRQAPELLLLPQSGPSSGAPDLAPFSAVGHPAPGPSPSTGRQPRRGGRRWIASLAGMAVLVLVLAAAVTTLLPAHVALATVAVSELTGGTGHISRSVPLPSPPSGVAAGGGSVWVTSAEAHALYRIDPRSGSRQTITVGAGGGTLAVSGTDVWVANTLDGTVSRVNMATNQVVAVLKVGSRPTGVAVGGGLVWVTDQSSSEVSALAADTGRPAFTVRLSSAPYAVAFGGGSAWLADPAQDSVTRVGPAGGPGVQISVGVGPTAVAYGFGSVWVANGLDSTVSRIDPATDSVTATIPVGSGPDALAVAGSSLWVANRLSSTLTRIDGRTGTATAQVTLRGGPVGLVSLNGRVWATTRQPADPERTGGTIRVVSSSTSESIDPALSFPNTPFQLDEGTYNTLVTTDRAGGNAGSQLVPDLALAMPSVTGGGTVYSFVLRPGLRYSDGEPVRPADFRHAVERVSALNPQAAAYLSGIVRIDTSDTADSVTFHLSAADTEFLQKLAFPFTAPVPPTVPDRDLGSRAVPSTGPYEVQSVVPHQRVVLVRNPYFRQWSAAAEPAGSPDRIVWTLGEPVAEEINDIEGGRADWTVDDLADKAVVREQHPEQFHANPGTNLGWAAFNTTVAPFNDVRVRRAFSLAADRSALVDLLGGPGVATPTCQFIPAGLPGYQRYCPYTVDPTGSGAWVGPDLPAARKLVEQSGTLGMKVTIWSTSIDATIGRFMVSVLDELGYRASVVVPSDDGFAEHVNDSRLKAQASDGDWTFDYPAPSDEFDQFWPCDASRLDDPVDTRNGAFFCDRTVDRLISAADRVAATDPAAAAADWAAADRRLVDDAPWVPLDSASWVDFLSTRVSNYQYSAAFGVLLDQLVVVRP